MYPFIRTHSFVYFDTGRSKLYTLFFSWDFDFLKNLVPWKVFQSSNSYPSLAQQKELRTLAIKTKQNIKPTGCHISRSNFLFLLIFSTLIYTNLTPSGSSEIIEFSLGYDYFGGQ